MIDSEDYSGLRGNVRGTVEEQRKEYDSWKEKAIEGMNDYDSGDTIVNTQWHKFLTVFFVLSTVALIVIFGLFVYYVSEEKLKSTVTQSIEVDSQINNTVNNEFIFDPLTENDFDNRFQTNITVIIESLNVFLNST